MEVKQRSNFSLQWDEMQKIFRDPVLLGTIIFVMLALIIFILWPLYAVLAQSFFTDEGSLTLQYYKETLSHSDNIQVLINTIGLGLFVSTISTIIGFIFAYAHANFLRLVLCFDSRSNL